MENAVDTEINHYLKNKNNELAKSRALRNTLINNPDPTRTSVSFCSQSKLWSCLYLEFSYFPWECHFLCDYTEFRRLIILDKKNQCLSSETRKNEMIKGNPKVTGGSAPRKEDQEVPVIRHGGSSSVT